MKHALLALSLGAFATLSAPAHADGDGWYADFDVAAAAAKESGKDMLVDFTGSDWCGWCIRLNKEVFSHDEWIEEASKKYVFVALDFPSGEEAKAKVPNPARNEELKEKYGIGGYPTIFLMTHDGIAYAKTGYQAGGPAKYLEHMEEIATKGKLALAATQKVAAAFEAAEEGAAKWTAWDALVETFNGLDQGSPFVGVLADHVRWGVDADPENKNGKKLIGVKALLRAGQGDDELIAAARALDPENEHGLLERVAEASFGKVRDDESAKAALKALDEINALGFKDMGLAFDLNFTAANWCAGPLANPEGVAEYAEIALEAGTKDAEKLKALKAMIG